MIEDLKVTLGHYEATERERALIEEVLSSGRLSYGPLTRAFEQRFASMHGCQHGIFLNSGTSALVAAIAALKEIYGWNDGDELLVPALTFIATSNAVLHCGLRPVFCDVDPRTYALDAAEIARRATSRTRGVLPMHMLGLPCDMDPITEAARTRGLLVLEDSCETLRARYRGRRVGEFGIAACFSTYMAHLLVTGVGGVVTTSDERVAETVRSLVAHGRDTTYFSIDDDDTSDPARVRELVHKRFRFVRLGYSFRATELEAAIGLAQLDQLDQRIEERLRCARKLTQWLRPYEDRLQLPTIPDDREHAFMAYPIAVRRDAKIARDDLLEFLELRQIETRPLFPLLGQPIYQQKFGDLRPQYPVASWLEANGFYVGCHHGLTDRQIDHVASSIIQFLQQT